MDFRIVSSERREFLKNLLRISVARVILLDVTLDDILKGSIQILGSWVKTDFSDLNRLDLIHDVINAFLLGSNVSTKESSKLSSQSLNLLIVSIELIWIGSGGYLAVQVGHPSFSLFNLLLQSLHWLTLVNDLISNGLVNNLTQLITHLTIILDFLWNKRRNWNWTSFWQWVEISNVIKGKEDFLVKDTSGLIISIQNIITDNDSIVVIVLHLELNIGSLIKSFEDLHTSRNISGSNNELDYSD